MACLWFQKLSFLHSLRTFTEHIAFVTQSAVMGMEDQLVSLKNRGGCKLSVLLLDVLVTEINRQGIKTSCEMFPVTTTVLLKTVLGRNFLIAQ
jgi:hypothetical protein